MGRLTPAVKAARAVSTGPQMMNDGGLVPDMGRRNMMNALLTGSVTSSLAAPTHFPPGVSHPGLKCLAGSYMLSLKACHVPALPVFFCLPTDDVLAPPPTREARAW